MLKKFLNSIRYKHINSLYAFFCALFITYFVFHIITGDRGLFSYIKKTKELANLENEYAKISQTNKKLEEKIKLLDTNSLNLDYLDEISRRLTGMSQENELVVLL